MKSISPTYRQGIINKVRNGGGTWHGKFRGYTTAISILPESCMPNYVKGGGQRYVKWSICLGSAKKIGESFTTFNAVEDIAAAIRIYESKKIEID